MLKVISIITLPLALLLNLQGVGILGRGVPAQPLVNTGGAIGQADLTYLGAYIAPEPTDGSEPQYSSGLTVRYESSDSTNHVHLVSAGFFPGDSPTNWSIYEWRDIAPGSGSPDPLNPSNYTEAPLMKMWGDVYSNKRLIYYQGSLIMMNATLGGNEGLYVDPADPTKLYWNYGFGYLGAGMGECASFDLGYSVLNYGAGTSVGHGPWTINTQNWKSLMNGIIGIPSGFATTYLSGKNLGVGLGGYQSLVAECDDSMGANITAVSEPTGSTTEQTALTGNPILGYFPYTANPGAGTGRMTRQNSLVFSVINPMDGWGTDKLSWTDVIAGGAWITNSTAVNDGPCFVLSLGQGLTQYQSSQIYSEYFRYRFSCYKSSDLALVALGTKQRYEIEPTNEWEVTIPGVDYNNTSGYITQFQASLRSITSITSTNGDAFATVTLPSHGYTTGSNTCAPATPGIGASFGISGAGQAEYNAMFGVCNVIDTNTFQMTNKSIPGLSFDGVTATGTLVEHRVNQSASNPLGMAFDPLTRKLYLAIAPQKGITGLSTRVYIHVWQID